MSEVAPGLPQARPAGALPPEKERQGSRMRTDVRCPTAKRPAARWDRHTRRNGPGKPSGRKYALGER